MLAEKLHENGIHNVGVVMSGIIGNALRRDGVGLLGTVYGQALFDRVDRDAFDIPGVKYIILKIGVNDVLHTMLKSNEGKLDRKRRNCLSVYTNTFQGIYTKLYG